MFRDLFRQEFTGKTESGLLQSCEYPAGIFNSGFDEDVDVSGGTAAAPQLQRPGAHQHVMRTGLIQPGADARKLGLVPAAHPRISSLRFQSR